VLSRRARPTIRVLREDLADGWNDRYPLRAISNGAFSELHPLPELPHPIILKAAESLGKDEENDNYAGFIASSTKLKLMEVKANQWRGAVWHDTDDDSHWLVAAGLAKGDHQDHDDFYERVKRVDKSESITSWLPTDADRRLLKREEVAESLLEWELGIQAALLEALRAALAGSISKGSIWHPTSGAKIVDFKLEIVHFTQPDYHVDEVEFDFNPEKTFAGSDILWQATTRALTTLNPPWQDWDRDRDTYMNILEPGLMTRRAAELETLVSMRELAESKPGEISHYTHRKHIADSVIDGKAMRALCGVFFVPLQDPEQFPVCPNCDDVIDRYPS